MFTPRIKHGVRRVIPHSFGCAVFQNSFKGLDIMKYFDRGHTGERLQEQILKDIHHEVHVTREKQIGCK